ncbi:MAG: sterol desaturase family protein [Deltaproteobacteria bacterium]|nr:sterol desaturase family protein [Deltaproteobacteria bacterium]
MFGLVDDPRPKHPLRGSPRMFKADWIEKYFSRVKPAHVLAIWAPIIGVQLWRSYQAGGAALPYVISVLAGVIFWTFLEYLLHRFVFHFEPRGKMQEDMSFLIHGIHHDYPWDADRLVMPPAVSLLIGALLYFPVLFAAGPVYFGAAYAGVAIGYVWYDLAHYAFHHWKPRTRLGRYLRSYHLIHHFKTPTLRYGVSTPLWDYVFGTAPSKETAAPIVDLTQT